MGRPDGFMIYERKEQPALSPAQRLRDFHEFHASLSETQRREQAARCMNCGVPLCQSAMVLGGMVSGCPLHNLIPEWNDEGTISNEERVLITQSMKEVNQIMESYVGIVRSNVRLTRAWNRLDILYEETERLFKSCKATRELCELRNMINVGYLITKQAMERKESRGLHYTIDYPHAAR